MSLQVAGHPGTVSAPGSGAWVVKQCGAIEAAFYDATWHASLDVPADVLRDVRRILPACGGVADTDGRWLHGWPAHADVPPPVRGSWSVALENLVYPFALADVCDIKIGTALYDAADTSVSAEKRARMERKVAETTSGTHGVRVTGYRVWDAHTRAYKAVGKGPGRAARTDAELRALLVDALNVRSPRRAAAICERLLPRVETVRAVLARTPVVMRGASLLIVTEAGVDEPRFDVRVIDFAHTRWASAPEEGVLYGLDTLTRLCTEVADIATV